MKNQRIKKKLIGIKKNLFISGSTFARSGTDFVARAALSQGRRNAFAGQVQISRQAQRFRKVRSRQAQHFRKVRYRFRGRRNTFGRSARFRSRRSTFARSGTDSRQMQDFRKRCQFRSRRSTFARYGAEFDAGAALNRGGWGGRQPRRGSAFARGTNFAAGAALSQHGAEFDAGAALNQRVGDVVVCQSPSIFQLFAPKDQPLLSWDPFDVLIQREGGGKP